MAKNPLNIGTRVINETLFQLPLEFAARATALLATRGAGKSYTSAVITEELRAKAVPVVIIDPTGAHWGIKSSANGKEEGLAFVIFGGDHADLPLEKGSGELVARSFIEFRFSCVLDLSAMRKGERIEFLADFLETLYRLNKLSMMLLCDEADVYAPQKPFGNEARALGAMEDIVRRGRIKGIGCMLISQRSQSLNKDVLSQCEVLFLMRMGHNNSIKPLREWIDVHATGNEADAVIKSLPTLKNGDAWVWAPYMGVLELVHIRPRWTYDSGRTPEIGETLKGPKVFATVDLEKLGADIKATAAAVKANDPKSLKAEVARLTAELAKKPKSERVEVYKYQKVEVPLMQPPMWNALLRLQQTAEEIAGKLATLRMEIKQRLEATAVAPITDKDFEIADADTGFDHETVNHLIIPKSEHVPAHVNKGGDSALSGPERKILTVLAQHGPCEKGKLAFLAGYRYSGGFRNSLSALRTNALISGGNEQIMSITHSGLRALGAFDPLPVGRDLFTFWLSSSLFGSQERKILTALYENPEGMTGEALAALTGYEYSGGFRNGLSALRTAGAIVGKNTGTLTANPELFK